MGLFSFLHFFKQKKPQTIEIAPTGYFPSLWEDDYCQIEIVPSENRSFIQQQSIEIEEAAAKAATAYGFTASFERSSMPVTTASKEIRVDYFEKVLSGCQFQKAKHIRTNQNQILNCDTGKIKAFGFSNFTLFFDTEDELIRNVWIKSALIVSVPQLQLIQNALYTLGEDCGLVLIDWNSFRLYNLADRSQIEDFLVWYFK